MTAGRVDVAAVADVALWVLYTLAALGALSTLALGGWIAAHKIAHRGERTPRKDDQP